MNIIVRAPLKANDIQQLLDGNSYEGYSFKFIGKSGIDMEFEATSDEGVQKDPADIAKALIKSTPYGAALYFSVIKK